MRMPHRSACWRSVTRSVVHRLASTCHCAHAPEIALVSAFVSAVSVQRPYLCLPFAAYPYPYCAPSSSAKAPQRPVPVALLLLTPVVIVRERVVLSPLSLSRVILALELLHVRIQVPQYGGAGRAAGGRACCSRIVDRVVVGRRVKRLQIRLNGATETAYQLVKHFKPAPVKRIPLTARGYSNLFVRSARRQTSVYCALFRFPTASQTQTQASPLLLFRRFFRALFLLLSSMLERAPRRRRARADDRPPVCPARGVVPRPPVAHVEAALHHAAVVHVGLVVAPRHESPASQVTTPHMPRVSPSHYPQRLVTSTSSLLLPHFLKLTTRTRRSPCRLINCTLH